MEGPIEAELKKGNELLELSKDVYAEVSTFQGKAYCSIRKWFKADDGSWYRTKNGLHLRTEEMATVLTNIVSVSSFIQRRTKAIAGEIMGQVKAGD